MQRLLSDFIGLFTGVEGKLYSWGEIIVFLIVLVILVMLVGAAV
ncbi:MAG: hypothetical protein AAGA64_13075 [Bacteroidota bacterium]